jgi:DNA-binding HxlR family transcriptional regulator
MEIAMSEIATYGQFCPVAMAAEIFCSRWTALVLREMFCGSTRFNDLRRGVPRMSPSLLSRRLRELQEVGVIDEVSTGSKGQTEYRLTAAGEELKPIVMALGFWGQRWVDSNISLKNLDPSLLMWDMRRRIDPRPLPKRRCTIMFNYPEVLKARQSFWLVVEPIGTVDLCSVDPGFDVDLYVTGSLRAMTSVWMGVSTLAREIEREAVDIQGDAAIARDIQKWLGFSVFAVEKRRFAA